MIDVDNLSQKINSKLGGINGVVNTKLALSSSSKEDLFMFFGADVSVVLVYGKKGIESIVRSRIRRVRTIVHRSQLSSVLEIRPMLSTLLDSANVRRRSFSVSLMHRASRFRISESRTLFTGDHQRTGQYGR